MEKYDMSNNSLDSLENGGETETLHDVDESLINLGDSYLKRGDLYEAYDAYLESGSKEKLIEFGDFLAEKALIEFDNDLQEYLNAKPGWRLWANGNPSLIKKAVDCYKAANAKEKLIDLGDLLVEKKGHYFSLIVDVYAAAKAKDKLVEFGDWLSMVDIDPNNPKDDHLDRLQVVWAYEAAGDKKRLIDFRNGLDYSRGLGLRAAGPVEAAIERLEKKEKFNIDKFDPSI